MNLNNNPTYKIFVDSLSQQTKDFLKNHIVQDIEEITIDESEKTEEDKTKKKLPFYHYRRRF